MCGGKKTLNKTTETDKGKGEGVVCIAMMPRVFKSWIFDLQSFSSPIPIEMSRGAEWRCATTTGNPPSRRFCLHNHVFSDLVDNSTEKQVSQPCQILHFHTAALSSKRTFNNCLSTPPFPSRKLISLKNISHLDVS